MAHAEELSSGKWRARYRDATGKRHSVTRPTRRAALAAAAEREREVLHGTFIDPGDAATTVGRWIEFWSDSQRGPATTAAKVDSHLRNHVIPGLGDVPLNKLTRMQVQRWVDVLSERLAPETTKNVYNILTKILADAVHEGLLRESPCRRVTLPKARRQERPFAEPATIVRIADLVAPHYRTMILTAAWTGMRWEEVTGLQRTDCQLLKRRITVRHALHEARGRVWVDEQLKSEAAYREISLPPFLVDLLAAHMAKPGRRAEGCPECGGDPVFTGRDGALLRRQWGARNLRPAAKKAGAPDLTFHSLRHSHRAWLEADGISQVAIDRRMGHASKGMTAIYGHVLSEVDLLIVTKLEDRFLASETGPSVVSAT